MTTLEPGSFLAELAPVERAELEGRGHFREYGRSEVLFHEGEETTSVGVIYSGRVKAFSHREHGGDALLDVRGPGALVGEVAAIDGLPRSATVTTMDPARVLMLTEEQFTAFLSAHGRVSLLVMRMLCRRWREADRRRAEFGMYDATGRVAQRLVELAERFGEPYHGPGRPKRPRRTGPPRVPSPRRAPDGEVPVDPDGDGDGDGASVRITLHLSQEELASWVGASREAVSKALGTLRQRGWIETGRRRVIVHDLKALRRHAR